jgi:hypothetical protein
VELDLLVKMVFILTPLAEQLEAAGIMEEAAAVLTQTQIPALALEVEVQFDLFGTPLQRLSHQQIQAC